MTTVLDDVLTELRVDFSRVRVEPAEARLRQRRKDTRAHRVAVADCLARIDGLLDLCLEADDTRR
jgi:hypothetical protein